MTLEELMIENKPQLNEGLVFFRNSKRINKLIKKIESKVEGVHHPDAAAFILEMKKVESLFKKIELEWKHGDRAKARKEYKDLKKLHGNLLKKINDETFKKALKIAGVVGAVALMGLLAKELVDVANAPDQYGATRLDRAFKPDDQLFQEFITRTAKKENVPEKLLRAVIQQESQGFEHAMGYNNNGTKDMGLMQLNTNTIPWLKEKFWDKDIRFDPLNPHHNVELGTKYLSFLYERYKGNIDKIITAYNAGIGTADSGNKPPSSTLAYIAAVKKFLKG